MLTSEIENAKEICNLCADDMDVQDGQCLLCAVYEEIQRNLDDATEHMTLEETIAWIAQ